MRNIHTMKAELILEYSYMHTLKAEVILGELYKYVKSSVGNGRVVYIQ